MPPTVATTNTVYNVVIHDGTLGTVAFHWAGLNRSFTLDGAESDEQVRNAIATAVGGFRGIGGANVSVTGTNASGFQIEFLNGLAGRDIAGLTVSTTAPEATAATAVARPADAGRSEIQTITFTVQPQATDLPATVETIQAAALGTGDVFAIDFTSPYNSKGLYTFHLGRYWYELRFVNNDVDNNQRYIREGLAWLLGTSTDNVWVKFDQDSSGSHRYFVKLTGELAGQSIRGLSVTEDFRGGGAVVIVPPSAGVSGRVALGRGRFATVETQVGTSGTPEIQRVSIDVAGKTGYFSLTLHHNGAAYQTETIPLNADATAVKSALTEAVTGLAGAKLTVTSNGPGVWNIAFGGSLAGLNIAPLEVDAASTSTPASGTFTITAAGQ
ncbi:MAG TPA: hypothetical protein PLV92_23410, partial [Pirellulaceae bacterium]|nr:hypothetical protein [Pirellulaceae bacterium]